MMLFQNIGTLGGGIGVVVAVIFFLIFVAVAYLAFRMLRRTVKMGIRLAIVGVILAVAVVGSLALWYVGSSEPARPSRPARSR